MQTNRAITYERVLIYSVRDQTIAGGTHGKVSEKLANAKTITQPDATFDARTIVEPSFSFHLLLR